MSAHLTRSLVPKYGLLNANENSLQDMNLMIFNMTGGNGAVQETLRRSNA